MSLYALLPLHNPDRLRSPGSRALVRLSLTRERAEGLLREIEAANEEARRTGLPIQHCVYEEGETSLLLMPRAGGRGWKPGMSLLDERLAEMHRIRITESLLVSEEVAGLLDESMRLQYARNRLATAAAMHWSGWGDGKGVWDSCLIAPSHLVAALLLQSPVEEHAALWRRLALLSPGEALRWLDGIPMPLGYQGPPPAPLQLEPLDFAPLLQSEYEHIRWEALRRFSATAKSPPVAKLFRHRS